MTCIHSTTGLCPACQADHDEDPAAWLEFGEHTDGIRRWEELQAEMDAREPAEPVASGDYPF